MKKAESCRSLLLSRPALSSPVQEGFAEVRLFDTGHCALETHVTEIATAILDF